MKKYALAILAASISGGVLAGNFVRVPSPNIVGILSSHPATAKLPSSGPGPVKPDPVGVGALEGIDFGSVPTGTRVVRSAVLRNTGEGPLSVTVPTAASVTGANFAFVSTTCGTSVAVGATCTTSVLYSALGMAPATGTLRLETGVGTAIANLTGQSLQGALALSASAQDFGKVQVGETKTSAVTTLTNSGNQAITGLTFAPPAGYTLSGMNCPAVLAANASCAFSMAFAPIAAKTYPAVMAISAANAPALSVSLSGEGVAQAGTLSHVTFGSHAEGTAPTLSSTLTNTGIGPLSITAPAAANVQGAGFSLAGTTCGSSLPAGTSCSVSVRYTPSGIAAASGSLTVETGAGTAVANLTGQSTSSVLELSYVGHQPGVSSVIWGRHQIGDSAGSDPFTVRNVGSMPSGDLIYNVPVGWTRVNSNCPAKLAPSASCTFYLEFKAIAAQDYSGMLSVSEPGKAVPAGYVLRGTGSNQTATLSEVAFGSHAAGTAPTLASTLTNTGIGALSITVPTAANVQGAGFSFAGTTCGSSLPVGSSCSISAQYTPSGVSAASGSLTVETGAGPAVANLTGQSMSSVLELSYAWHEAGVTPIIWPSIKLGGYQVSSLFTVRNIGSMTSGDLSYSVPAGWTLINSNCPSKLVPAASCTFYLEFRPTAAQNYTGTLSVSEPRKVVPAGYVLTGAGH
jgi:hypothetical protein